MAGGHVRVRGSSPARGGATRRGRGPLRDGPTAAAPTGEHDTLISLQRLAGNAAVTSLVVQRDVAGLLGGFGDALGKMLSPALKVGDHGPSVLALQQTLNSRGAALLEDSDFGPATRAAVVAFRRDSGLPAGGEVDEQMWTALRAGGPAKASAAPGLATGETWAGMSSERRADFTLLGYTAASWAAQTPPLPTLLPWELLPEAQRAAATRLGYTPDSWSANRDATARTGAAAMATEERRAKRKAGRGVLPAKFIGTLRARSILKSEYGSYVSVQLPTVHLLSESEMKTAYEKQYGVGSYTPINGFTVKPDIYLNKDSIWAGTTVHESLHIQEHTSWDAFAYRPSSSFGEGATTILTEAAMTSQGQPVTHHPYANEVALVSKMAGHSGMDKLKDAYFKGATADFQTAVTAGLTTGTTWAQFRALVDAGTLAAAQAKLK